jgi:hypothetical protein
MMKAMGSGLGAAIDAGLNTDVAANLVKDDVGCMLLWDRCDTGPIIMTTALATQNSWFGI